MCFCRAIVEAEDWWWLRLTCVAGHAGSAAGALL
jgi:hypothetical protein